MKKIRLSVIALAALLFAACENDELTNNVIEYTAPELELSAEAVSVASAPGAKTTVTVTTDQTVINADADYSCKSWLKVTVSGTTVTIEAKEANPNSEARTGKVHIIVGEKGVTAEKWVTVEQAKNALSLAKTDVELGQASGSSASVDINTELTGLTAIVSDGASSWLSATINAGKLEISVLSDNTAETIREAVVTVKAGDVSASVNVVQKGNTPTLELTPGDDIKYHTRWVGSKTEIAINTNKTPAVSVSAGDESWLKAEIDGTTLTISIIATNEGTTEKTGTVTVTSGALSEDVKVTLPGNPNLKYGTVYNNEGIIFWQNPENPKEYKVISAVAEKHQWSAAATDTGCSGGTLTAAEANAAVKAMSDYATNNYAVKYCEDMGPGWYLPVAAELDAVFAVYNGIPRLDADGQPLATVQNVDLLTAPEIAARNAFEATLLSIPGGVKLEGKGGAGDSTWLCRETSGGAKAYYYRWGKVGIMSDGSKNGTARYARCVKVVTIE